jgi:DNA-binding response OmpR family regulator
MLDAETRVLGIDPDRERQTAIGPAMTRAQIGYRFVTDPKKAVAGARQVKPHLVLVFGESGSDTVARTLDSLTSDVAVAQTPVALVCEDLRENQFVISLRSGVVALFQAPFNPLVHVPEIHALLESLPMRQGSVSGTADSPTLNRLVEHLRRARRSGQLVLNPRAPNEATATFARGRPEAARYLNFEGVEALVKMVAQPQARYTFIEAGGPDETPSVVIAMEDGTGTDETLSVVAGIELGDEPLSFSLGELAPPAPSVPPLTGRAATLGSSPVGRPRILLVDDDIDLCRMFETLFTKHGFDVTVANDGIEGYDRAVGQKFDLVIADLNMPHMDGWGMLRQLRDDFRARELPVAFLSCHDDYRESLRAQDAGAQAYFSKGNPLSALVGQVKRLLVPRDTVRAGLDLKQDFVAPLSGVGPQWLLSELETRHFTGKLTGQDSWAQYELVFNDGRPLHAFARSGRFTAEADRAFNAFVASKATEVQVHFGAVPSPQTLFMTVRELVGRAVETLNENERRMRDALMVTATQIEVQPELYRVYQNVGPKQWLEAARLLCEERLAPKDVIQQLDVSPVEVEETMKDLVRRGVLLLRKA